MINKTFKISVRSISFILIVWFIVLHIHMVFKFYQGRHTLRETQDI